MTDGDSRLVTYCGLYCGDCHGYQQTIPDLARDLRKELRACRYDLFADALASSPYGKDFQGYETCYRVLGAMVKFRCHRACRGGGGPPSCKVRNCVGRKGLDGCWECGDFETCPKLEFLGAVHGDAHLRNLRRLKRAGKEGFAEGKREWYHRPGGRGER